MVVLDIKPAGSCRYDLENRKNSQHQRLGRHLLGKWKIL